MSVGLVVQHAVIALLAAASAVHTARRLAPKLTKRRRNAIAPALLKPGRAAVLNRIGRALQPGETAVAHGNRDACGDGRGACGSYRPPSSAARPDDRPLTFHPHRR
ncbi:DUF6587 family protein [Paraburkholderia caballeronis]|uniref:DUF6587 family protein n=1 Tax=Paraburkholderia caballeronis TaxID=416943 RepID=UPI00106478AE|nr:DUF6587 family protein [Paraburkholderia caballeronis]TDV14985.1 hypothetical protein C7408_10797 [Paraburkholderia caballeronis]TDV16891.1 hypothetical protein C7406_107152 [Paraburkholderia caballeronis]TDV25721.1 hypothetical protein C7404_10797 [Paraburkholderia caballeronis]